MSEMKIKDGKGTGNLTEVNANHQLETHAISETEAEFVNSFHALAYIMYIDITPTGANDIFFYMKNTNTTKDLEINWYRIWTESAAEAIDVYVNKTGTPTNTTTVVPVNLNTTSNNTAVGDFYESVGITGISGGTLLDRLRLSGDGKDVVETFPGKIIVPPGGVVSFQALTGAIPIEFTVSFHYKEAD